MPENILANKIRDTFSSLKNRNYRLFFIGQWISSIGFFVQGTAQAWIVLKLTGSGLALGIVLALQFLPFLFISPLGGLIADKYPKKKILLITNTLSIIIAVTFGFLVLTDTISLWIIYVFALLLGLVNIVDNPARHSFISELVHDKDLLNAVTLNSVQINLARAIGPVIAGVLITTLGVTACFFINAFSFMAVIISLLMIDMSLVNVSKLLVARKGHVIDAFIHSRKNPVITTILLMMAIIGTLTYEFQVSLPMLAEFAFGGGAGSYALLTSAFGVGAVIGGVYTATTKKTSMSRLVFIAVMFGLAILTISISSSFMIALISLIFCGVFSTMFASIGRTMLQLETAPEMRGRVLSFWNITFLGSTVIGAPIIGFIGQKYGAEWALATGGIAALVAAIIGVRALKEVHHHEIRKSELNKIKAETSIITTK